jgi:hypothetical protein
MVVTACHCVEPFMQQSTLCVPNLNQPVKDVFGHLCLELESSVRVPTSADAGSHFHLVSSEQLSLLAPLFAHAVTQSVGHWSFKREHPIFVPLTKNAVNGFAEKRHFLPELAIVVMHLLNIDVGRLHATMSFGWQSKIVRNSGQNAFGELRLRSAVGKREVERRRSATHRATKPERNTAHRAVDGSRR